MKWSPDCGPMLSAVRAGLESMLWVKIETRTGRGRQVGARQTVCGQWGASSSRFWNPIFYHSFPTGEADSFPRTLQGARTRPQMRGSATWSRTTSRFWREGGCCCPPFLPSSTLHPSPGDTAEAGGWGNWPCVLEQLQQALGPPGMRDQAAHQDFYGNLLLETAAAAAAAARGLPAAGAAAAAAAAGAPRPLPTPRRGTRTAPRRAARTSASRGLPAGERSRGNVGRGRWRRRWVPLGDGGRRETLPSRLLPPGSAAAPGRTELPPARAARRLPALGAAPCGVPPGVRVAGRVTGRRLGLRFPAPSAAAAPPVPCRLFGSGAFSAAPGRALRERTAASPFALLRVRAGEVPWGPLPRALGAVSVSWQCRLHLGEIIPELSLWRLGTAV